MLKFGALSPQNLRNLNIHYEQAAASLNSSPLPPPSSQLVLSPPPSNARLPPASPPASSPPASSPPALSPPTSNARPQLYSPPLPPSSLSASPQLCLSVSECREQLAASHFTGDRDTRPTTVTWFLKLVERVVDLGDDMCHGVSRVDKLLNTVHSYIWKDPKYGKDRAYRWMLSWIGAKCAVTLGVRTYGLTVSWETFTAAFREEFDPDEREHVRRVHREQFGQDKERERVRQDHREQSWQAKERQPEQEKLRQRRTHFGQDKEQQCRTHFNNDTEDKVAILEKRVVLLERHIMRVEQELRERAFPENGGSSNGGLGNGSQQKQGRRQHLESPAWRDDDIHSCRICLVVFESGSQLHKNLQQSKHFSPAASASPASTRQSSPARTPALALPASSRKSSLAASSASSPQSSPPTSPALPSLALQPAASLILGRFDAITPQSPGLAPSRSSPGAREMYDSDNESTETMDLETHLEMVIDPATVRQSSPAPTAPALPPSAASQHVSTPPPSSPCRPQPTPSLTLPALPSPVPRLAVSPPPPCPALLSPASQPAASPILGMFGAITPQLSGLAPSPGAKEMFESENESTESPGLAPSPGAKGKYESNQGSIGTMDLETQLEAVFTQILEFRWTRLSADRLPVLRPPDDVFEPWDVNLISSFDQQTHS
ncbi:hypothetical protein BDD12DRAFT_924341 [Trichophaea hybrida]|nr:hypothetical protein BDD12DRAFT_924341 [Trichophaea hybrida]